MSMTTAEKTFSIRCLRNATGDQLTDLVICIQKEIDIDPNEIIGMGVLEHLE